MAAAYVSDFSQFKAALEDTISTEIYFTSDIVQGNQGVRITRSKGTVVIDGQGFSFTEYYSAAVSMTVGIQSGSSPDFDVTIKNVDWHGYNFYGIMYCAEGYSSNVTIRLQNLKYTGPQTIYSRRSTLHITDCQINIIKTNTSTDAEELAEISHVHFYGDNTVYSEATNDALIWFVGSPTSLSFAPGATLQCNIVNSYGFYSDGSMFDVVVGSGAHVNIEAERGLFMSSSQLLHGFKTLTLEQNSYFRAIQRTRYYNVPVLKLGSALTVNRGATLIVAGVASSTSPASTPLLYFGERATVIFDDPKNVVLYNNNAATFRFAVGTAANPSTVAIDSELVNIWSSATTPFATAGGFTDVPTSEFAINEYDHNVTVQIAATTSTTALSSLTSNLTAQDKGYPMTTSNFNIVTARVISMGRLPLSHDKTTDISTEITGQTEPNANVRAVIASDSIYDIAGTDGSFALGLNAPLAKNTEIELGANYSFLRKFTTYQSEGSVRISHLDDLIFRTFVAPLRKELVKRVLPNWYVEITDTRDEGAEWKLYASLPEPMQNESGSTLESLVLVEETTTIISPTKVLIAQGESESSTEPTITTISWQELQGFLLQILPDYPYQQGVYTSHLNWELEE